MILIAQKKGPSALNGPCFWAIKIYIPTIFHIFYHKGGPAKVWNGPSWDKVGIEFTGSQPDPNFLPSLAPTNQPSNSVDISIFFDLKEIKKKIKKK